MTSDAHLALLGRAKKDVVGECWKNWMTKEDVESLEPYFQALITKKKPFNLLTRIIRPDGKLIRFVAHCSPMQGSAEEQNLMFCELVPLEEYVSEPMAGQVGCAERVRDLTYELAAYTGRHGLRHLTQSLVESSADAEKVIELLSPAADRRLA